MPISDSIILVNHAGSPLGKIIARHFARSGSTVIICDANERRLLQTSQELADCANNVFPILQQNYHGASVEHVFDQIKLHFSQQPNLLINCWTGIPCPALLEEHTSCDYLTSVTGCLSSLYRYAHVYAKHQLKSKLPGVIINVLSSSHRNADINMLTALVSGVTQQWAKELMSYHIRVGAVVPPQLLADPHNSQSVRLPAVNTELLRNIEYVADNEYFNGRVVSSE